MTSAFTTKALLKNSLSAHTKNPSSSGNITQPPPSSTPGMVITKKIRNSFYFANKATRVLLKIFLGVK